jgi:RNA polymerase sigma factor (sigma-70 family)
LQSLLVALMADAFTDYLRQIAGSPLLTTAEEIHLGTLIQSWRRDAAPDARRIRSGQRALSRVVTANLRLVVAVVKRSHSRLQQLGIDPMDAVQAGNLGLIRAAQKFDPARGYRFSTYAFWWVKEALNRFLHEQHSSIHIPANVLQLAFKVNTLLSGPDRSGSIEAIAAELEEKPERLRFVLRALQLSRLASLDQRLDATEPSSSLLETVWDGRLQEPDDDYGWLYQVIGRLSAREQQILALRYGDGDMVSLSQVADGMGLSRYQVQRLERLALRKLRTHLQPMLDPQTPTDREEGPRSHGSHRPGSERLGQSVASRAAVPALQASG